MADATQTSPILPAVVRGGPIRGEEGVSSLRPAGRRSSLTPPLSELAAVLWENRDSLPYALRLLRQGVCDGCSLGPRGLQDDVLPGTHLCRIRLQRLRDSTVGPFEPAVLSEMAALRRMDSRALRRLGRVPYPFIYRPGDRGFTRVSWKEALGLIGGLVQTIPPERQGWLAAPGGITNEAYYAFTKAARLMGTNNVDICARHSHSSMVSGLFETLGVRAATLSLSDLIGTDLILLWGTDLAHQQPVLTRYLHAARAAGARIASIQTDRAVTSVPPWVSAAAGLDADRIVDDVIRVRVGGDVALLNAILKVLLRWGAVHWDAIAAHTEGWEALVAALEPQALGDLLEHSGVRLGEVEWLATLIARARSMVTICAVDLPQHRFGAQNVQGIVNLHLSQGAIGRPHAGILPLWAHAGVQGGAECGVAPAGLPGDIHLTEESARHFSQLWGHPVPTTPGLSAGRLVHAAHQGALDFLYHLGGSLIEAMPDPRRVVQAFRKIRLRVHQDTHLNPSVLADPGEILVLLPAQTRDEQRGGGTSTSVERRIRFSPEIPGRPPVGEARPAWEIPGSLAVAARPDLRDALSYRDAQDIRDEMAVTMPSYKGIETLRKAGDWIQWGGPQLCARFASMPGGRARFSPLGVPDNDLPEGWLRMTTRPSTPHRFVDLAAGPVPFSGGADRGEVFLSLADARRLDLREGDPLRLINAGGTYPGRARIVDIAPGHVQTRWPEASHLIDGGGDPLDEEPGHGCLVRVEPG